MELFIMVFNIPVPTMAFQKEKENLPVIPFSNDAMTQEFKIYQSFEEKDLDFMEIQTQKRDSKGPK